jgi:hypothetical protein
MSASISEDTVETPIRKLPRRKLLEELDEFRRENQRLVNILDKAHRALASGCKSTIEKKSIIVELKSALAWHRLRPSRSRARDYVLS